MTAGPWQPLWLKLTVFQIWFRLMWNVHALLRLHSGNF